MTVTTERKGRAYQKGAARPAAKLTDADVQQIRSDAAGGMKQRDIADAYGISQGLVSGILTGTRCKPVPATIRITQSDS
jgi:hypothetical protein